MEEVEMLDEREIAEKAGMKPIEEIAQKLGLNPDFLEKYGKYKAKLSTDEVLRKSAKRGKLIMATAMSPTPAGEGKTTTSIGLADAMNRLGKKTTVALREPSLGPVLG